MSTAAPTRIISLITTFTLAGFLHAGKNTLESFQDDLKDWVEGSIFPWQPINNSRRTNPSFQMKVLFLHPAPIIQGVASSTSTDLFQTSKAERIAFHKVEKVPGTVP